MAIGTVCFAESQITSLTLSNNVLVLEAVVEPNKRYAIEYTITPDSWIHLASFLSVNSTNVLFKLKTFENSNTWYRLRKL